MSIPFNRPVVAGKELDYIQKPSSSLASVGRRRLHRALPALARRIHRRARRPAHPFVHRGAGDGGDACRPRAGRRSHHAVVHLRLDRQRVRRCAARVPVFVDIRAGHAQHRRAADRGRDHAAHQGDRSRALRRRAARDGRHQRHRRRHDLLVVEDAAQALGSNYTGRNAGCARPSRARSASTRPRTSSAARAARWSSTTRRWSSAPRSSARRAPTAASSSAARSTNTPGSTRLVVPAERAGRCVPVRPARADRDDPDSTASRAWNTYHAALTPFHKRGIRTPVVPATASTTPTSITC